MIRHYKGVLGEFDYDDTKFELKMKGGISTGIEYLMYKDPYIHEKEGVKIPKGCINTRFMFYGCSFTSDFFRFRYW